MVESTLFSASLTFLAQDWGLTGDVSDHTDRDIMGNVICCELNEDGSGFGAEGIEVANDATVEQATAPPPENTEQEVISIDDRGPYHYVQETFNPIWFESPQWNGGSYEESSTFCAETSRDGHALELCSVSPIPALPVKLTLLVVRIFLILSSCRSSKPSVRRALRNDRLVE